MKKPISLLLALAMTLLVFVGCAEKTEENEENNKYIIQNENGEYSIKLPSSEKTITICEEYEKYVPYISDKLIKDAEEKINKKIANNPDKAVFYLQVDEQGYLNLACENIIMKPNPGSGSSDHEHKFYNERISKKAFEIDSESEPYKILSIIDLTQHGAIPTPTLLEQIYFDDEYTYYLSTKRSGYITVTFANGEKMNIIDALKNKYIKITDFDKFGIEYFKIEGWICLYFPEDN